MESFCFTSDRRSPAWRWVENSWTRLKLRRRLSGWGHGWAPSPRAMAYPAGAVPTTRGSQDPGARCSAAVRHFYAHSVNSYYGTGDTVASPIFNIRPCCFPIVGIVVRESSSSGKPSNDLALSGSETSLRPSTALPAPHVEKPINPHAWETQFDSSRSRCEPDHQPVEKLPRSRQSHFSTCGVG